MANPKGNPATLRPMSPVGETAYSQKVYGAKVDPDLAEVLEQVEDRAAWIRSAFREKAEREGLIKA